MPDFTEFQSGEAMNYKLAIGLWVLYYSLAELWTSENGSAKFRFGAAAARPTQQQLLSDGTAESAQCSQSVNQSAATLKLLVPLPHPSALPEFHPSWSEGPNVIPAMNLARDQINNSTDLLPCHQLELTYVDGGCDIAATTAVGITTGLFAESAVVGMIGPGCSSSSVHAARILNRPDIELVQIHGGGSFLLEDRNNFNNSIGILGSSRSFVQLSLKLMNKSDWLNIAILYENNRIFYRSTKELFVETLGNLTDRKVNVLYSAAIYTSFYPLDGVRSSLARIVFVFTAPSHLLKIMCLAYHMGMVYPAYQWVIASSRLEEFFNEFEALSDSGDFSFRYEHKNYNCSLGVLLNVALNRTFFLNYQLMPVNLTEPRYINLSFNQFLELYKERASAHKVLQTYWAYMFYDAVWAWAKVLDRMLCKDKEIFDNFQYGNKTVSSMILDQFYAPDFEFEGMSGLISFNPNTGFYERPANLYQIHNGEELFVGYNNENDFILLDNFESISDSFRSEEGNVSRAFLVVFELLQFILLIVVVALHVLTVLYRNSRSVKASSPKLSHFAFAGVYFLLLGLILFLIIEIRNHTSADGPICHFVWAWTFPIAFTLSIGTVIVRTWRLYRIFFHYMDPGKFISNTALIAVLIILLSVDVVLATVWTAVDQRKILAFQQTFEKGQALEIVINTSCRSEKYERIWFGLVVSSKLLMLGIMVLLTWLTRGIPNKTYATTYLRVFSYTFSLVIVIGFSIYYFFLYFITLSSSNVRYSILYITMNMSVFLYIIFVFSPPLVDVVLKKIRAGKQAFSKSMPKVRRTTKIQTVKKEDDEERVRKTSKDALL